MMMPPKKPRHRKLKDKRRAVLAGRRGEQIAIWWMRAKAYRLVVRNYQSRSGEIDIIMRRGRVLVFVEVKYRADRAAARAAMTARQWGRIARAAGDFTRRHPAFRDHQWRFDLIACAPRQWPRHIADCWRMR